MIEYVTPENVLSESALPESVLPSNVSPNRSSKKYSSSKSKSKSESIDQDMINNATSITRRRIPRSASEIMDQIEDEEKNVYNRFCK